MRRIVRGRRRLFGSLIVAGTILGLAAALAWPSAFRADIEVVVARSGDEPAETTLERDAELVNAGAVRTTVRALLPNAPDRIDVEVDDDRRILRLVASGGTPDEALRLVRTWADAFVEQRQLELTTGLTQRNEVLEAELDRFAAQIGDARQLGEDAEVGRLQALRDAAAAERVQTLNQLTVLQQGDAVAIVGEGELPTDRSGVRLVPALALGAVLGAMAAALAVGWLDRASRRADEAQRWFGTDERVGDPLASRTRPRGAPPTSTPLPGRPSRTSPAAKTSVAAETAPPAKTSVAVETAPAAEPSVAAEPSPVRTAEPASAGTVDSATTARTDALDRAAPAAMPRIAPGRRRTSASSTLADGRIRFPARRAERQLRIVTLTSQGEE